MRYSLFYLPSLHRRSAPDGLPNDLTFFPSGLPVDGAPGAAGSSSPDGPSGAADDAWRAAYEALPLKGREAASLLDEMLSVGDAYADGGFLRQLHANHDFMEGRIKWRGAPGEFADLDAFAATGTVRKAAPAAAATAPAMTWEAAQAREALPPAIRQALLDCQKVLLLAWWREEKLLELAGLERRFLAAESALSAALGEDDALPGLAHDAGASGAEETGVPWRVMLDAASPFLPETAALFTVDASMTLALREAGVLRPLPEESAAFFAGWPQKLTAGLMCVRLPVWRLVGRKGPLDERPWLTREVEVFAV